MVLVEVERKLARKAGNNARSTVRLGCILSPPLYMQTHFVTVDGRLTAMSFPKHKVCLHINKSIAGYVSGQTARLIT
jgi:hypothetical protein